MRKRIGSALLCLCLVLALLPGAALADGAQSGAIRLGAESIPAYDATNNKYAYIYYGSGAFGDPLPSESSPIKWRVLDNKTNLGGAGLFLLSDILLGTGTKGDVVFDNSPIGYGSNDWNGSSAQAWCNDLEQTNLTPKELAAVLPISQAAYAYPAADYADPALTNEQVFFPSVGEVTTEAYGFKTYYTSSTTRVGKYNRVDAPWLLRTALAPGPVTQVAQGGAVLSATLNGKFAARPAFNLDKSAVLFISAATGGKTSGAVGAGALQAVADGTAVNEWKLTLKDSGRISFSASLNTASRADVTPGGSVLIDYAGAETGSGEYISALLVNSSDTPLYYGNIANAAVSATAQPITIPAELAVGNYTLKIFNEQCHGDKYTDYASDFQNIAITVRDTTPPTLTPGAVERTGETAATVKFTSNEPGAYYYAIADENAAAPTIDTTGAGTPCDTSEQTITPALTAGAKDIYIVVKDAAGNVSSRTFKMNIPAYVPPALTAGNVERIGDTAATVKFTSNKAGAYYYAIADENAAAPTIDTTGAGTPCDTTEQTIAPALTAGAKDIYIVVKDAGGNVSSRAFKMNIPAYALPALTAGRVERTGESSATVKFTSNNAGQYYYEIVEKDAPAPTIETAGRGTPCDTTEQTITPLLSAGAKDIYIVVKDRAGNVSSRDFKMTIPAYVSPVPVLTAGAVARTGDTAATVKFTSNEPGAYYYAIVDENAAAPTIDTTGAGTPCDTSEQTITPALTAGAKDIYIVVKDAGGNVSSGDFYINIPAYAPALVCVFTTRPATNTTVTAGSISGSLTAAATVMPAGTAELSWFLCDPSGAIIGAALGTGGTFPIPASLAAGTYYYLCQASCAGAASVDSNVAAVTVNATPMTVYTITAAANNAAYGSVTGGGSYNENAPVTLTPIANNGCRFLKWTEDGADAGTDAPWSFTATSDRTIVAVFDVNTDPSASENSIAGIVSGQSFTQGASVTFTAVGGGMNNAAPSEGDRRYLPTGWMVNPSGDFASGYRQSFSTAGMSLGAHTLNVTFTKQRYGGGTWADIAPAVTDTKSVSFTLVASPAPAAATGTQSAAQDVSVVVQNNIVTVAIGNTATLSADLALASGYQWYGRTDGGASFQLIPGATGASYTTPRATMAHDGYRYYCVAANGARSVTYILNVVAQPDVPATGGAGAALWLELALAAGAAMAASAVVRRRRGN